MPRPSRSSDLLPARAHRALPALYLVFALTLTGLLCFLTAPFFAPDEAAQSLRAIAIAHGQFVEHMGPDEAGGQIDVRAWQAIDAFDDIRMDWERRSPNFLDRPYGPVSEQLQLRSSATRWAHRTAFEAFQNTAVYPPTLYLPASAGWCLGEAFNLTILHSLRLARLCCALTAVLLGCLALRLCACSRWMLLPLLLLPTTLFLNASSSQDAVLLPVAALVAAILSRPLTARRNFTRIELISLTVLLAACATARPPYLALAVLFFLPAVELRARTWLTWLAPAAAFLCVVAACDVWLHLVSPLGLDTSQYGDPALQAVFLRAHPFAAGWTLLKGTVAAALDFGGRGAYVIGWNDLLPHHGAAPALVGCLAVILLLAPPCPLWTRAARTLLALSIVATLLGISLAEYLIWSPPGSPVLYGVLPRYWLPLMPIGAMLLHGRLWPGSILEIGPRLRAGLLLGATALLALISATLPWMAAHAFYRDTVAHVFLLSLR